MRQILFILYSLFSFLFENKITKAQKGKVTWLKSYNIYVASLEFQIRVFLTPNPMFLTDYTYCLLKLSPLCLPYLSIVSSFLTSLGILLLSGDDGLWRENIGCGQTEVCSPVKHITNIHSNTISYPSLGIITSNIFTDITLIVQEVDWYSWETKSKAK